MNIVFTFKIKEQSNAVVLNTLYLGLYSMHEKYISCEWNVGILRGCSKRYRRDGREGNVGEKDASRYDRGFRRSDFCELPSSKNCSILHQGIVETAMYDSISKYGLYRYFSSMVCAPQKGEPTIFISDTHVEFLLSFSYVPVIRTFLRRSGILLHSLFDEKK